MSNSRFAQAAFRHVGTGEVVGTGSHHDIDQLPGGSEAVEHYEDGFLGHDGQFYNRQSALALVPQTELAHDGKTLHSEDLGLDDLSKSVKDYDIETPQPHGHLYKVNVRHTKTGNVVGSLTFHASAVNDAKHPHHGYHRIDQADVSALHRKQGLYGRMLQAAAGYVKHTLKSKGLVSEGHWRSEAATGAWDKVARSAKVQRLPGKEPDAPDLRMSEKLGISNDAEYSGHEWDLAFKAWLHRRSLRKDEGDLMSFMGLELGSVTAGDHRVAGAMLGSGPGHHPEFMAARFMANSVHVAPSTQRLAFLLYEHDLEMAALFAYNLPRTEVNREILRSIMRVQSMSKSELDVAAIPRLIEPAVPQAKTRANLVRLAFRRGQVHSVNLGTGKHSKGTAIAWWLGNDERKVLLKPGSGPASPASGIAEQTASQSRREVAFAYCSELLGLGTYVPHADLLLVDGQEVAAIDLIDSGYKNLTEKIRDSSFSINETLAPYLASGDLFRWAFLDYLLGSIDRHGGNVMVGPEGQIKLIDAGSSMAGFGFNPSEDAKAFIPCYLRGESTENWHSKSPADRLKLMPRPNPELSMTLARWMEGIDEHTLVNVLTVYGILHDAIVGRLRAILAVQPEQRVEWLLGFWAGIAK